MPNYCTKHNYECLESDEPEQSCYGKLKLAKKLLPNYDFIMCMDVDAIFTNFNTKIEDITDKSSADLIFSHDPNGINIGIIFIRNSDWSINFIITSSITWQTPTNNYDSFGRAFDSCAEQ